MMADLARIKRNVAKMAAQNAPMEDIDGYIASEGTTVDAIRSYNPARAQPAGVPEFDPGVEGFDPETGMVEREKRSGTSSFLSGAADTAGAGFGDEIAATVVAPFVDETRDEVLGQMRMNQRRAQADNPGAYLGGQVAGGVAQAAALGPASMAGRAAQGGAGLGRVALGSAVDGAALGGLYGAGSGENMEQRLTGARDGAVAGAVIGGAAPYAVSGVVNGAKRLVTPFVTSAERTAAAQTLAREGVETTAGQRTGSNALRYAESEIGGGAAQDVIERQAEQFTAAALKRAGVNANRATPDVIDGAFSQVGKQFDDLGSRNKLIPDGDFGTDMQAVLNEYGNLVPPAQRAPIVENVSKALAAAIKQHPQGISGKAYQALRSRLETAARGAKSDPQLSQALRGIRSALDDAMERSIAQTNPNDLGAFQAVRGAYRNLLVIEQAATGAGENAALGLISPSALRNATVSKQGRRGYARGQGDFAELARAGEAILKPLPNSGTAGRVRAQNLGSGLLAGGGALAGGIPGMVAGLVAPRVAGAAMMSKPGQAFLSNQLMSDAASPELREMLSRLLGGGARPLAIGQ